MLQNLMKDKETIVTEIRSRIIEEIRKNDTEEILEIINDTLYRERERLRKFSKLYKNPGKDKVFYKRLSRGLGKMSNQQLIDVLDKLVQNYLDEIVGRFDPLMYKLATAAIPSGLTFLLNTMSPFRIMKNFPEIPSLDGTLIVSGAIEKLQRLKEKGGVLIYVPEHQSNLDSPVLGLAIYKASLPPVMYGAGLNLFQMPLFPVFMNRLGAYTVDRLKTSPLYKRILKEFAAVTMENGYDHLFFPGGTRSRSGLIEKKLKKGLLGTALKAFVSSRQQNKDTRFYIVPITISYHLVLEASTLIEDHLKETGKSRYIIIDDESSKPAVIFDFMSRLFSLEAKIYLNYCEPLDPFGNRVDDDGNSIDRKGRVIDMDGYIKRGGKISSDDQRDQVYTNELAEGISSAFLSNTILLTTHIVAYTMFRLLLKKSTPGNLFKFLREDAFRTSLPFDDAQKAVESLMGELNQKEKRGEVKLEPAVKNMNAQDILMNAIKYFQVYHGQTVVFRRGNRLFTRDPNLLYYYQNRIAGYDLEVLQ